MIMTLHQLKPRRQGVRDCDARDARRAYPCDHIVLSIALLQKIEHIPQAAVAEESFNLHGIHIACDSLLAQVHNRFQTKPQTCIQVAFLLDTDTSCYVSLPSLHTIHVSSLETSTSLPIGASHDLLGWRSAIALVKGLFTTCSFLAFNEANRLCS